MRKTGALIAGALLFGIAGSAQGAVTVIGGGFAEECSRAANRGETAPQYEALCTAALENEWLSSRDRAGTLVNRGIFKLRRMEYIEARRDFDRAVRLDPNLGEAYVNRGASFIGQRRYAESLPEINKGLELGIEEPAKAYYNRALAYEGLENAKAAYFDYRKAVEIDPEWAAPREQLTRFTVTRAGS